MQKDRKMKVVTISGSVREGNNTDKALSVVEGFLKDKGVKVFRIDAKDLNLSFPGLPASEDVELIQAKVKEADGIIMATPEYHGSYSSVLKMIIENLNFPSVLAGKPVSVAGVHEGFDAEGNIKDEKLKARIESLGQALIDFA